VSITAGCNSVENYSAFLIGLIGAFIYIGACKFMNKLKIDDPCSATQIHGFCGFWGVIAVGFFKKEVGLIYSGSFR
jgi:Amt family ammonium transporter